MAPANTVGGTPRAQTPQKQPIAFIRAYQGVTPEEAKQVMAALQIQMDRDFTPVWHTAVELHYFEHGDNIPSGYWWLSLLDNSDQAGALGYHDLTPEGRPHGKCFVGSDLRYGLVWSVTASHELMEMAADPDINRTVVDNFDPHNITIYALEVADACEDDAFAYKINGVLVSDFVYPAWFHRQDTAHGHPQYDHTGHITRPFQLLRNGYIGIMHPGGAWSIETAEKFPESKKHRAPVGSRRERRQVGPSKWSRSAVAKDNG